LEKKARDVENKYREIEYKYKLECKELRDKAKTIKQGVLKMTEQQMDIKMLFEQQPHCLVCTEDFTELDSCVRGFNCRHILCIDCLSSVQKYRNICPYCEAKPRDIPDVMITKSKLEKLCIEYMELIK